MITRFQTNWTKSLSALLAGLLLTTPAWGFPEPDLEPVILDSEGTDRTDRASLLGADRWDLEIWRTEAARAGLSAWGLDTQRSKEALQELPAREEGSLPSPGSVQTDCHPLCSGTPHPPILITADEGPTGFIMGYDPSTGDPIYRPGSGVSAGTGTEEDPYIIEGWVITSGAFGTSSLVPLDGIRIEGTSAHVVVRENRVERAVPVLGVAGAGVHLVDVQNIQVRDNIFDGNDHAVLLREASDVVVSGNSVSSNLWEAMLVMDSHAIIMEGNIIAQANMWDGIVLLDSHDNVIVDNEITVYWWGLMLQGSTGNLVEGNTFDLNGLGALLHFSEGNGLENNGFTDNFVDLVVVASKDNGISANTFDGPSAGLVLDGASREDFRQSIDASNLVNGDPLFYLWDAEGVEVPQGQGQVVVAGSRDILIEDHDLGEGFVNVLVGHSEVVEVRGAGLGGIHGAVVLDSTQFTMTDSEITKRFGIGLLLWGVQGGLVGNNTFDEPFIGVALAFTEDLDVLDNQVEGPVVAAVEVYASDSNRIIGNLLKDSRWDGVFMWASDDNLFRNNDISGNSWGLFFSSSPGSTIEDNLILDNNWQGLYLSGSSTSGATVSGNNIAGNRAGLQATGSSQVDAEENWWGCEAGPADDACDSAEGSVDYDPWLQAPNPDAGPGDDPSEPPEPPLPPEVHQENHTWEGELTCSVVGAGYGLNGCALLLGDDFLHDFVVEEDAKSLVVAVEWEPGAVNLQGSLRILYEAFTGVAYATAEGTSPIEFRVDDPVSPDTPQFRVFAGGGLNVVIEQEFTVHYHIFYGDYAPDGHSALPPEDDGSS